MKKTFIVREVKKNIFLLEFYHEYDMCMTFLRYQEYYESPSPKFRGRSFKILDFMKWYSLKFGNGSFTYPTDWAGFNFYGDVIKEVRELGIPDLNNYDTQMLKVYQQCKKKAAGSKFYIIGVVKGNGALEHEVAHGLYYLNPDYRKEMNNLVKKMDPELRKVMDTYLLKVGYTPGVFVDETQANMATTGDFTNYSERNAFPADAIPKLNQSRLVFEEVFKRYTK